MGISIVVGGTTVRFPDNSLGVLDPDTVESTLVDVFQLFGATQEEAEQKAADSAPTIIANLDGQQPDLVGPATENIAQLLALLIGGFYLQQSGASDNFDIEDDTLGIIDPDTARETIVDQLIIFGFSQEAAEEVADSTLPLFLEALVDNPGDVKRAIVNISGVLGIVAGGMTAQGQGLGALSASVEQEHDLLQNEIQNRINADDQLRTEIEAEEAAREEADADLTTRIDGHDTALEAKADLAALSASVTAAIATAAADATTKANAAQAASLPASYLDTDTALAANSDVRVPSQKALLTFFTKSAPRHRWTSGVPTANTVHAQASGSPVDQRVYWGQPYDIRKTRSFDRIGITHVSGVPTTATIRFGFVHASDLDGVPAVQFGGAEIANSTTMLTTGGTGLLKLLTINATLTPDTWFPILVIQFTGTQPVIWFAPNTFQWQVLPDSTGSGNVLPFQNSVAGAIPSTLTPAFGLNSSPVFFLRPT